MIRINLLREDGSRVARKPAGRPALNVSNPGLLFALSAAVCAAVLGFLWWNWSHQIGKLDQEMLKARAEQARLASIEAENQRYQLQVRALEDRIRTIESLEASRTGPVHFMSSLGLMASRTNGIYLISVAPDGDRILLKGMADSVPDLAGFIAALKQSGAFADVQLRQYYQDDQPDRVSFKFDLDCQYRRPAAQNSAASPVQTVPGPSGQVAPNRAAQVPSPTGPTAAPRRPGG